MSVRVAIACPAHVKVLVRDVQYQKCHCVHECNYVSAPAETRNRWYQFTAMKVLHTQRCKRQLRVDVVAKHQQSDSPQAYFAFHEACVCG